MSPATEEEDQTTYTGFTASYTLQATLMHTRTKSWEPLSTDPPEKQLHCLCHHLSAGGGLIIDQLRGKGNKEVAGVTLEHFLVRKKSKFWSQL